MVVRFMARNELVELPEPGILFTRDNAQWAYHALKFAKDRGTTVPEQDELLDELQRVLWPPAPRGCPWGVPGCSDTTGHVHVGQERKDHG